MGRKYRVIAMLRKWLVGNPNNIVQKSIFWNMVSSLEYSLQSAVLLLVITRISGPVDAGVFTIAYAVAQMMATIGSYGMQSFQVSDAKQEYGFSTYFTSRLISVSAMVMICAMYSLYQGYTSQKLILIAILCGYRVVDDIEDVLQGEMQRSMRLDIAARIMAIRILGASVCFAVVFAVSRNLVYASLGLTICAALLEFVLTRFVINEFTEIKLRINMVGVWRLLLGCLPLCVGGFLYNYLVNAPKYSIDRNLTDEMQTIFNVLFMPTFGINMLSIFIFKPMIAPMGKFWREGKDKEFIRIVIKQFVIILGLTVLVIFGGMLVGLRLLGFMYGLNLQEYMALFAMLLFGGGVAAAATFCVDLLSIIRRQGIVFAAYMRAGIWCCVMSDF